MKTFATELWRGVPPDVQLDVRVRLWLTGDLLDGLLVAVDGDQLVGSIAIDTTETVFRLSWSRLAMLRELGALRMARFVCLWAMTHHRPAPDEAYLHTLVVAAAHRRRSAARMLTTAAEARARQWGKRLATILVEPANTPSRRLMEGLGYRFAEPRHGTWRALLPTPGAVRADKVL
jgi:ribosomal protein S18 acetylase RimI-like enzyme